MLLLVCVLSEQQIQAPGSVKDPQLKTQGGEQLKKTPVSASGPHKSAHTHTHHKKLLKIHKVGPQRLEALTHSSQAASAMLSKRQLPQKTCIRFHSSN